MVLKLFINANASFSCCSSLKDQESFRLLLQQLIFINAKIFLSN